MVVVIARGRKIGIVSVAVGRHNARIVEVVGNVEEKFVNVWRQSDRLCLLTKRQARLC